MTANTSLIGLLSLSFVDGDMGMRFIDLGPGHRPTRASEPMTAAEFVDEDDDEMAGLQGTATATAAAQGSRGDGGGDESEVEDEFAYSDKSHEPEGGSDDELSDDEHLSDADNAA